MGDQMKRSALLFLLAACASAAASAETPAAGAAYFLSGDSERFVSRRASVDGIAGYQDLENRTGVRYTDIEFSQNGWRFL